MTKEAIIEVQAECGDCGGTGIYRGLAEPKGIGVVCLGCNGRGMRPLKYRPFTGRKKRGDVTTVRRSAGRFIATGVGPVGGSVNYADFLNGKMP